MNGQSSYKLTHFICCERIESDDLNRQVLIAPFPIIELQCLPSAFSFGLSFGIYGINAAEKNVLSISMRAPDGSEILNANTEIPQSGNGSDCGMVFGLDTRNVMFNCEGEYAVNVSINGEALEVPSIMVKNRKQK